LINWGSPDYRNYAVRVIDTNPYIKKIYNEEKYYAAMSAEDKQIELTSTTKHVNIKSYYSGKVPFSIKNISKSSSKMTAKVIITK
jgi:hypothetical protein